MRVFSAAYPGADLWRATPDADGRFEIGELSAGEWYVEAVIDGGGAIAERVSLGRQKAGAKDVELRLPR